MYESREQKLILFFFVWNSIRYRPCVAQVNTYIKGKNSVRLLQSRIYFCFDEINNFIKRGRKK